jgi:hypothetical protein
MNAKCRMKNAKVKIKDIIMAYGHSAIMQSFERTSASSVEPLTMLNEVKTFAF